MSPDYSSWIPLVFIMSGEQLVLVEIRAASGKFLRRDIRKIWIEMKRSILEFLLLKRSSKDR